MSAADRIRRCAQAVADELGGNHLRYADIVAVVLYADESVNGYREDFCHDWDAVLDKELQGAAGEGADALRERLATRKRAA